jgi:hypothetical protein
MKRGIVLAALVFLAVSCGGSGDPHAQARAEISNCQAALVATPIGPVTAQHVAGVKRLVAKAAAGCGATAKLRSLARKHPTDNGLGEAYSAEVAADSGLVNFGKYLADVAAGKTGHQRILNYSTEVIRQAKLLLTEALVELSATARG